MTSSPLVIPRTQTTLIMSGQDHQLHPLYPQLRMMGCHLPGKGHSEFWWLSTTSLSHYVVLPSFASSPDMSGREGDLSSKQRAVLNQLRNNLKDVTLPDSSEYFLLRWLRARSFDLQKAEKMLRKHIQWRKDIGIDHIMDWEPPEVLVKYFPGGYFGVDKEGYPLWFDTMGLADVKGLAMSSNKKDVIKYKIKGAEYLFQKRYHELSQQYGKRIDECSLILDMTGFTARFLWKPVADIFVDLLKQLEANYPETLRTAYIINAPTIFPIAYNLIKPFLSDYTKSKIRICGSDYKKYLQQDINADQIPLHWGGTAKDPDGDPHCKSQICMGGAVPETYYKLLSLKESADMDEYKQITIKASSSVKINQQVDKVDSILRWNFWTDGKDIAFGINYVNGDDEEEVVKCERVNSHMIPEHGTHRCERRGQYIVHFDNKYSWMSSKKLSYQIEVLAPDEDEDLPNQVSVTTRL